MYAYLIENVREVISSCHNKRTSLTQIQIICMFIKLFLLFTLCACIISAVFIQMKRFFFRDIRKRRDVSATSKEFCGNDANREWMSRIKRSAVSEVPCKFLFTYKFTLSSC